MPATVLDVTDATFQQEVVDGSRETPVIVDFWAPWCGPCRILGPVLESLADEYEGKVRLVKLNTDENPGVAQAHQIEGIPAVFAYQDGQPVSQFEGALPEPEVREFVEKLLPSPADDATSEASALLERGQPGAARESFEKIIEEDPNHEGATAMLAYLLLQSGEEDRAAELAGRFPKNKGAKQTLATINLRHAAKDQDADALRARVAGDDTDAEARYRLGALLASDSQWPEALEHLLTSVRLDRHLDEDAARLLLLDAFIVLGDKSELTQDYRRKLGSVLF